jgi:hypothetical protein
VIPTTDEPAVRAALADLTGEQPDVSPARLQSVRRRAVLRRRRQLAGVVASALAVAGLVIGVTRLPAVWHPQPQARHVPGWALPWPDHRNGSVPQSVLNNAVLAWHFQAGEVSPSSVTAVKDSPAQITRYEKPYHVVWYVGQTIDHGQSVVVMFEATGPAGPQLVVGSADASQVMQGQPAESGSASPWELTAVTAPRPSGRGSVPAVSQYVPELSSPSNTVDNWIVVLTAPGVSTVRWYAPGNMRGRSAEKSDGLVIADAGQVTGDVVVCGNGPWGACGTVGTGFTGPAAVPALAQSRPPTPPAAFGPVLGWTGQGNETNEDASFTVSPGRYQVLATCYNAVAIQPYAPGGHGPLQVTIDGHAIGAITCDNMPHALTVPRSVLRTPLWVAMSSSNLTAWRVEVGTTH